MGTTVYDDNWGSVVDHSDEGFLEIIWTDETSEMTGEAFNEWLGGFAGLVEQHRRPGVLVDSRAFMMEMELMDGEWRDRNIIPRYNHAGVEKFAFVMPPGMPAIGAEPAPEGPGSFPTGYFGTREDAVAWLAS